MPYQQGLLKYPKGNQGSVTQKFASFIYFSTFLKIEMEGGKLLARRIDSLVFTFFATIVVHEEF